MHAMSNEKQTPNDFYSLPAAEKHKFLLEIFSKSYLSGMRYTLEHAATSYPMNF
jgi:hypothetical protein